MKELEAKRLALRTMHPTVPPTTEYELTLPGEEMIGVIQIMSRFGTLRLDAQQTDTTSPP